jgi:hypothetical protein
MQLNTKLPPKLIKKAIAAYRENPNMAEIGMQYGVPHSTLRRAFREMKFDYLAVRGQWLERTAEERRHRQIEAAKKESQKQKEARKEASRQLQLEEQNESLRKQLEFVQELKKRKAERHEIPVYKPHHGEAIPVLLLSDLHAEERVRPGDVAGCNNVYNPEVFKRRLRSVFSRSLYMTETHRNMAKIDSFCLWLGGDLISGHIHDDLAESNFMSPLRACSLVQNEVCSGIEHLLKYGNFKKLIIPCNYGNHGRTTEKRRVQTGAENSYEHYLYTQMAREWRNEKRIEFHIADGYHLYLRLFDTLCRFHHGDAINYGGGVGGITIPVLKAIANWNTIQRADLDMFGHFHHYMDGGSFVANSSLIGYGAYALQVKAAYEAAQQAYLLIDRKRGKSLTARIFPE